MENKESKKQPFKALSRICLNNWHYIDHKVLSFDEGINFFTGHSGSGKSTVIDALQIVLYANTDGRGFFNKAASDDSDRSLIEYLRGMINIGENNEFSYLRNKNFSTTIVLELMRTDTQEKECVGIVFDVDTTTNDVSRMFFWHKSALPESCYRKENRSMSIAEIKSYLQQNFQSETCFYGNHNERFRRQLYENYLGGLDMEKFPLLFKRAIPFRMNIKLEDFVKEYICMEQKISVEDMQESVLQYGRMRKRIEDTQQEIQSLTKIKACFSLAKEAENMSKKLQYIQKRLEIKRKQSLEEELKGRMEENQKDLTLLRAQETKIKEQTEQIKQDLEELIGQIKGSGYEELKNQLAQQMDILERLMGSKEKLAKAKENLAEWEALEDVPNRMLWDIEKFTEGSIREEELIRLKETMEQIHEEKEEEAREIKGRLKEISKKEKQFLEELKELKQGKKAYPRELEQTRRYLEQALYKETGKEIPVRILADLLDVKKDTWRNAIEGYLAGNKINLIVAPAYAKIAMELFREQEGAFHGTAVVDTEKLMEKEYRQREGSLAEEVSAKEAYVQSYIRYLLGNVMKCDSIDEMRSFDISVTRDCMRYRGFRLSRMNPEEYTRRAYIGDVSVRSRIRVLEEKLQDSAKEKEALLEQNEELLKLLQAKLLMYDVKEYLTWMQDESMIAGKEKEKEKLILRLNKLREENFAQMEEKKQQLEELRSEKESQRDRLIGDIRSKEDQIKETHKKYLEVSEEWKALWEAFTVDEVYEKETEAYENAHRQLGYDALLAKTAKELKGQELLCEERYNQVTEQKAQYLKTYVHRSFSASAKDNTPYELLLEELNQADLEHYRKRANEQAKAAMEHFKDDFIFKIRSAIREALQRKDELNRIIRNLDFGKDRYEFVIGKSKGPDGKYYDMFMDDALEVQPSLLSDRMENQLNMFTMEHEDQYGDIMNELISIFIPPENATAQELEEAKRNIAKYSDYRTYLSFDMQQIIHGENQEVLKIRLSKMIKKNSGGEGQNPLYVALLASFAQAYHINTAVRGRVNPTLRLVVLDEAFSKMDAEKVASCIALIRGLGFQAIISATNDKIQNYLENVDKTFVYANPNKKAISIKEFAYTEFDRLLPE